MEIGRVGHEYDDCNEDKEFVFMWNIELTVEDHGRMNWLRNLEVIMVYELIMESGNWK